MSQPDDHQAPAKPRAWQRMLSGRRLDLLNPDPRDINIGDIAHGLARVARWNGQTRGEHPFSVAQHALIVEEIVGALSPELDRRWRLAALLHDAPEYVVGDLISPFKAAIGIDYKAFELRLLAAIHSAFGLPAALPAEITALIKVADQTAAFYEATGLAGFAPDEAEQFFQRHHAINVELKGTLEHLNPSSTFTAQADFLRRFETLTR